MKNKGFFISKDSSIIFFLIHKNIHQVALSIVKYCWRKFKPYLFPNSKFMI